MTRRRALPLLAALAAGLAIPALADVPGVAERWAEEPARVFEAVEVEPADLLYVARPVVVFANSPRDPAFIEQMEELARGEAQLVERDVIVVTDTDPSSGSPLRRQLRPRGFSLVLMGKDGQVALRKPLPLTVRELSRTIDKMPARDRAMTGS